MQLNEHFGPACRNNPESARLLQNLSDLVDRTGLAMLQSGVVSACARCAASARGSCCFREMGESYDSMELFVNLLLGSDFPEKTEFPGSCHFVGKKGCTLRARQSFCLNYFCPDLKESIGSRTILRIQQQVGKQLAACWELERALARYMADADKQE